MWDLIGFDDEKLFSHWGFSRRGMLNGVVDANSNKLKRDRRQEGAIKTKDGAPRERASEGADENSGKRGEEFLCIPLRGKRHGTLFRAVGHSMSFALI